VITAVPAETPYTIPVVGFTVAIVVGAIDHVPPAGVLPNAVVFPTQTSRVPVIGVGAVVTVTIVVAIQPEVTMYVMVQVPGLTPVRTPPPDVMEAVPHGANHVPPVVVDDNVMSEPAHTAPGPVIAAGDSFTVIVLVVVQPVPNV
jgi:hypothetical protein